MKILGFICVAFMACIYAIAALIACLVTLPFQLYYFYRWFLDSRFTPRK